MRRTSCPVLTSAMIRCSLGAFIPMSTRRSHGSADLTSTKFRSTRHWRRHTTTSAMACIGRRSIAAGRLRAEFTGRRLPVPGGTAGFQSFPQPVEEDKVRGKPAKFADHYTQAALFYESQSPVEQAHIVRVRFELTKVQVPAIRERVVSQLANVNYDLARAVAEGLGIDVPDAQTRAAYREPAGGSEALTNSVAPGRPGQGGYSHASHRAAGGGRCRWRFAAHTARRAVRPAPCRASSDRDSVPWAASTSRVSLEAAPSRSVRRRGAAGWRGGRGPREVGHALEFMKDQYRHCKTILALGAGATLLDKADIPGTLPGGRRIRGFCV